MVKLTQKKVSKADLAKFVEEELKCSRRVSIRVINGILNFIQQNLAAGNQVQLSPFGTFEARHRAGHKGKSPKTGETFLVKAKRVVVFRPGKALKNFHPKG